MRNVCQLDILVGARDRNLPPGDVARRVFEALPNCRVLRAVASGPRFSITVLLPEMRGGFCDSAELKGNFETAFIGKGIVVASVHGVREATAAEVLERTLARKR